MRPNAESTTGRAIDPEGVNHPRHYQLHPSGVEPVEVCRYMSFNVGNAVKYLLRAAHKGSQITDLRKAVWYLEDETQNGEALPRRFSNRTWQRWLRLLAAEQDPGKLQLFNCLYEYQEHGSVQGLRSALEYAKIILKVETMRLVPVKAGDTVS